MWHISFIKHNFTQSTLVCFFPFIHHKLVFDHTCLLFSIFIYQRLAFNDTVMSFIFIHQRVVIQSQLLFFILINLFFKKNYHFDSSNTSNFNHKLCVSFMKRWKLDIIRSMVFIHLETKPLPNHTLVDRLKEQVSEWDKQDSSYKS